MISPAVVSIRLIFPDTHTHRHRYSLCLRKSECVCMLALCVQYTTLALRTRAQTDTFESASTVCACVSARVRAQMRARVVGTYTECVFDCFPYWWTVVRLNVLGARTLNGRGEFVKHMYSQHRTPTQKVSDVLCRRSLLTARELIRSTFRSKSVLLCALREFGCSWVNMCARDLHAYLKIVLMRSCNYT